MVEVRFKPTDVGTVTDGGVTTAKLADGAVTNIKVDDAAGIIKTKLAPLAIVDADVNVVSVAKVDGAVSGKSADTTGDKDITAIGWDSTDEEFILDHEV